MPWNSLPSEVPNQAMISISSDESVEDGSHLRSGGLVDETDRAGEADAIAGGERFDALVREIAVGDGDDRGAPFEDTTRQVDDPEHRRRDHDDREHPHHFLQCRDRPRVELQPLDAHANTWIAMEADNGPASWAARWSSQVTAVLRVT